MSRAMGADWEMSRMWSRLMEWLIGGGERNRTEFLRRGSDMPHDSGKIFPSTGALRTFRAFRLFRNGSERTSKRRINALR